MRAVVFPDGINWAVQDLPEPVPGPNEVLLSVVRTGVCGTDEHLLHGGFIAKLPLVPGHEIVGKVSALGDGVTRLSLGQNVVVDNASYCGRCGPCSRGEQLFCSNFHSLGCNAPGGFAEKVVVREDKAYPIGDLAPAVAVFTEPLACVVHGFDVLDLGPASSVLVFGAGPTGLLLAQMAAANGASSVTVAAPTLSKLRLAKSLGADRVVQLTRGQPQAALSELRSIAPEGFDAVLEATGAIDLLESAVGLTRTGGSILVYGVAGENEMARFSPYEIFSRELTIRGSFAQANCIERSLSILQGGRVRTEGIITDTVGFDSFGRALENLHRSEQVKTVFDPEA